MSDIEELRQVIHKIRGAEATHRESLPVKDTYRGRTVWEGIVEVFHLHGPPHTETAYAWSHDTDDPKNSKRHITVLHIHPALSPLAAVRAAILQEYRLAHASAQSEAAPRWKA